MPLFFGLNFDIMISSLEELTMLDVILLIVGCLWFIDNILEMREYKIYKINVHLCASVCLIGLTILSIFFV